MDSNINFLRVHQCGREQCAPGHTYGPAVRDHYLLHWVLSGKGRFTANGHTWELQAGDAFLILPGQVTVYSADRQEPWCYGWVGLLGDAAPALLQQLGDGPVLRFTDPVQADKYLRRIMRQFTAWHFTSNGNWFLLHSELYRLLSLFVTENSGTQNLSTAQTAAAYIRQNFANAITIDQLAALAGVHRSHLFRLFQLEFGVSPQQYLCEYRLQQAAQLLVGGLAVTQAAYSAGFGDLPYFCRRFKARYGVTPSAYAQQARILHAPGSNTQAEQHG